MICLVLECEIRLTLILLMLLQDCIQFEILGLDMFDFFMCAIFTFTICMYFGKNSFVVVISFCNSCLLSIQTA